MCKNTYRYFNVNFLKWHLKRNGRSNKLQTTKNNNTKNHSNTCAFNKDKTKPWNKDTIILSSWVILFVYFIIIIQNSTINSFQTT